MSQIESVSQKLLYVEVLPTSISMNVLRFRRIYAVHHHTHRRIAQCAIDGFSILLHLYVDLLLDYN